VTPIPPPGHHIYKEETVMIVEKAVTIEGMTCHHCVMAVSKKLSQLDTVQVKDVQIGSAILSYDEAKLSTNQITAAIEDAGYKAIL